MDISEDISMSFGLSGCLSICIVFAIKSEEWCEFFLEVTDFTKYGKPANFDYITNKMELYSKIFFFYGTSGCITYGGLSLFQNWNCKESTATFYFQEICRTYVPLWFPFNFKVNWLIEWSIFIAQYILTTLIATDSALICFLLWESAELIITHITNLKEKILQNLNENNETTKRIDVGYYVQYHCHLLR